MVAKIPDKCGGIIPYLVVPNALEAIEFYSKAFGAVKANRMAGPDGHSTMHAQITLGDTSIMLTDENPQWGRVSAKTLGGSPAFFMIYVENVDEVFDKAVAAGCEVKAPVTDMFWGDRMGKLVDPFGFQWSFGTHIEDVPPEEMATRQQAWFESMGKRGG